MTMSVDLCYTEIAEEFSSTRYSVWKKVKNFLDLLPETSLVGDIGCGNGKNMMYRCDTLKYVGVDSCKKFVEICKNRGLNVEEGNILSLEYKNATLDYVICIAVIHHLNERVDRIKAISELLRVCKTNGKILIYVWSINQYDSTEKRKFLSKDEMVPFVLKSGKVYYRYYHLYDKKELCDDIIDACTIYGYSVNLDTFTDKNNECVIIQKL